MEKRIKMRDMLQEMKALDSDKEPIPFNIECRAFSEQNLTGGKLTRYEGATLMQQGKSNRRSLKSLASGVQRKNPNHFENKTRNIKTKKGVIRKINILFITQYNGQKVVF